MKYAVKRRKRIISLVLGLVLMLGSAVGPFAMGAMADPIDITATLNEIPNSDSVLTGTLNLSGSLTGSITSVDVATSVRISLTFTKQTTDNTQTHEGSETISAEGIVTLSEEGNTHSFNASATIGDSHRGNTYKLTSIELSNTNQPASIIIESVPNATFTVSQESAEPEIVSATLNGETDNVRFLRAAVQSSPVVVRFSDPSKHYTVQAKVKVKGDNGEYTPTSEIPSDVEFTTEGGTGIYTGNAPILYEIGEYRLDISAEYEGSSTPLTHNITFSVRDQESDPVTPTITKATLGGSENNIEFIKSTTQIPSIVVEFSDNTKTYTVTGQIMKKGDGGGYVAYNPDASSTPISITKSNGSASYTGTMPLPNDVGNYRLDITATYDTNKTLKKEILFTVKDSSQGNPTGTLTFETVRFTDTDTTVKEISRVDESTISLTVKVSSTLPNEDITVTAELIDTSIKYTLIKGNDNTFTYSFIVPKYSSSSNSGNFYGLLITATGKNSSPITDSSLRFTVTPKPIDSTLRLTRELSSNSQVGNNGGQIFTEGGTVRFVITSGNSNIRFTNDTIRAEVSANNGKMPTYVPLTKTKTGTYANRRYEGTFEAGVPLASNFYYTITNEAFPYTVAGGTGGTAPAEAVAFTTASNKPYIKSGNLAATYTTTGNSNIQVSPGYLIVGNVINCVAQLENYSNVHSVNLEFTNRSGMTNYNINIPLTKANNVGRFTGSYTIAEANRGFTYDLNKASYKTSQNAAYIDMENRDYTVLSFTVTDHTHTFGGTYQYNSEEHWQNSTCNADHPGQTITGNRAKHIYNSSVERNATQTTSGVMRYTCTVCGYTYTATIPSLGSALSVSVVDTLATIGNGSRVYINFDNNQNAKLNSNVFTALRGTTKELELQTRDGVSWIFKGRDITGTAKDIDISTSISSVLSNTSPNVAGIRRLVGNQPTIIIDFANNGNLPGRATVRVPISAAMLSALGNNRTGLKVQFYNSAANRLDDIANNISISTGNYVEFAITHNSSYIITKEVSQGGSGNNNSSGGGQNGTGGNTSTNTGNTNTGNTNTNSGNTSTGGNKKPTTTTTTTVIHKVVSPKTLDGSYTWLWIAMFAVGALLVISSICMTRFEEECQKRE